MTVDILRAYVNQEMFGKPIIGRRRGGTDEPVAAAVTRLLIDANDPPQVAEAVEHLLVDCD